MVKRYINLQSALVLALVILITTWTGSSAYGAQKQTKNTQKAWTVLVYLAGDNNLDEWGFYSLNLMAQGLVSDKDVQVVIFFDHLGANAELIEVAPGSWSRIADYGEPDTGNPDTLRDFLILGLSQYPAERTLLVLWDHGGGWKTFGVDDTSHTRMSMDGIAGAMAEAELSTQKKIDITVFDACLMAMVEVAAELRQVTQYMVASTYTVDSDGFPYDLMLSRLITNTYDSTEAIAHGFADDYYTFCIKSNSKAALSVAAVDESKLNVLMDAIDGLSKELIANMDGMHGEINSARAVAEHQVWGGHMGVFWYIDLWVFADELIKSSANPSIDGYASAVQTLLTDAVYHRHSNNVDNFSYGLTISFPSSLARYWDVGYIEQNYQGINLDFTADTHWDEMLLAFYPANEAPHGH